MGDVLITNIGELCTLKGGVRHGADEMQDLAIQRNVALAIEDGHVAEVGPIPQMERKWRDELKNRIDAGGRCVIPGLVDAHTHAVFAGERADEFEMRLQGAAYADILKAGGGILSSVRATREATPAELLKLLLGRLDRFLEHGCTTVEVKTGYGLDKDSEMKSLDVMQRAATRHAIDIVPTFLGAHAIPPEFPDDHAYAKHVVDDMLPDVGDRADFVDVFCEEGVFDVDSSRLILQAALDRGYKLKVHADELAHSGGSQLAAELGATSADHLLFADEADREALMAAGVIPVLLPATAFTLRAPYADARALMDAGCAVALATDFNPNAWCDNMQFAIALSCHQMRMTPAQAISGATMNSAAANGREDHVGSIEHGKLGDVVILDAFSHKHLGYRFGSNNAWKVVKAGDVVYDAGFR